MSIQSEINRIKGNVNTTLNTIAETGVTVGSGSDALPAAAAALANEKQDKLTFDTTPKANSTNPVTSGGVYTALSGKANTSAIPTKTSQLTNDSGFKTTDNNTTYTFATGDSNGQIKVTPSSGSATNVSVKGLGTAAYTASTAYATAAQGTLASNALPKAGGTLTGALTAYGGAVGTAQVRNVYFGTDGLTAGSASSQPEGTLYFSYE